MSPMASRGSSPPATPEKTTVRQPNRSARECGDKRGIDLAHTRAGQHHVMPVDRAGDEDRVRCLSRYSESARMARRCASSCGMAQISPMVTPQCASPLAVEQRQLMRVVAVARCRALGHGGFDGRELLVPSGERRRRPAPRPASAGCAHRPRARCRHPAPRPTRSPPAPTETPSWAAPSRSRSTNAPSDRADSGRLRDPRHRRRQPAADHPQRAASVRVVRQAQVAQRARRPGSRRLTDGDRGTGRRVR